MSHEVVDLRVRSLSTNLVYGTVNIQCKYRGLRVEMYAICMIIYSFTLYPVYKRKKPGKT